MVATLVNKHSGEKKNIKVGWSWTCFFFSSCFGIPLFLRRLNVWGAFMCALLFAQVAADYLSNDLPAMRVLGVLIGAVSLGISIGFGRGANRMAFVQYLEDGWEPLDPNSPEFLHAKRVWKLAEISGTPVSTALNLAQKPPITNS